MINNGGVSRTPRTWTAGDDEPEDGTRVRDALGGEWVRRGRLWHSKIDPRLWSWVLIRGPLVEVLPDAPGPQPEGCCTACHGEGGFLLDPCSDCQASGHAHDSDAPCPAPESVAGVSSVSPEGETTPGEGERRTEALKARWYPVVDDTIGGWAISNVDLPVSQIDTRDGEHFTVGDFLSENIARHICDLHNATLAAGWCRPQPADTMRRCPARAPESALIPTDRQCQLIEGHGQAHTWYGENGDYSSWARSLPPLSGVELRDVEERDEASEEPSPPPPPIRGARGRWIFRGYDQLSQPVWSWSMDASEDQP